MAGSHDLPRVRTSFVGRGGELEQLERLLGEAPVLTLVGPGGVGKTRLAIELGHRIAHRFPAGVRLADLSPLSSAESVEAEVATLLGVLPGSGDPIALLGELLGDRRVLLLLDNCEHLVDAAARFVHRLVGICPEVHVLATSREPLGIAAEVTVPVLPLQSVADAARLFVDRARATDPGFAVPDSGSDVVEAICRRLDGLPLAIELAAPWVRVFTPAELLPRLDDRFEVLAARRRDLPERQRTMRATVDWSHHLLSEPQRVVLRRLAVFRGTFDAVAAREVCCFEPVRPSHSTALLAELVERSVLVVDRTHAGSRFRLLETVKDYAAERLAEADEVDECRRAHFAWYLTRAEEIDHRRTRTGSDAEVPALVPDGDNYRAALSWGAEHDPQGLLRLAAALEPFWMIRSVAEGRRWLTLALDRAPGRTRHRARALIVAPLVVAGGLPWAQAHALIEESIDIYESAGDEIGAALAQLALALGAFFQGELGRAAGAVEEALRRHHDPELPLFRARAAIYLGASLSYTPRRGEEGRRLLRDGEVRARAIGDGWGLGVALTVEGLADLRAGYGEQARRHLTAALHGKLQGGVTATALGGLGELDVDRDPRRALVLLEAATAVRQRAGVPQLPVHIGRQLERAREAALRRVPSQVAERCRAEARARTTEEIIALALTEPGPGKHREADRLTPRQQEIASFVAAGLSNREIAARLHLSVRTVETHVENILAELGFRGRVQLAGWVRDVGLPPAAP